ncbi:MAG TPA: cytochrome c oxidase subunit II [Thermoanaerobaculia bacterium]|nr:cytochrome c oxidase subunit II [Thermoanaerobaculia bacterium]
MFDDLPLFPEAASSVARDVDQLYWFLIAVTGAATMLVIVLLITFAIKYRRTPDNEVPDHEPENKYLEYAWIVIPFIVFMVIYVWGAQLYFRMNRPPDDALEVWATGKRWMWKFQHIGGQQEINELHVPLGRPVKLIMASEDVIHSFYAPAMRVKRDVLPSRYTTLWFEPIKAGRYHLFCAEYCGTEHSKMIGSVIVLPEPEYQAWLAGGTAASPLEEGERLYTALACNTCHAAEGPSARGPSLNGLFGTEVRLRSGQNVIADENYLRESILNPGAKIVAGYDAIMPSFQGQVDEQQLIYLLTYIKSLGVTGGAAGQPEAGSTLARPESGAAVAGPAARAAATQAPDTEGRP